MPLHRFDNQDFDKFVRDKFEGAPIPSFNPKAWDSFVVQRRGPILKYWVSRLAYLAIPIIIALFLTQFAGHFDNGQNLIEFGDVTNTNVNENSSISQLDNGPQQLGSNVSIAPSIVESEDEQNNKYSIVNNRKVQSSQIPSSVPDLDVQKPIIDNEESTIFENTNSSANRSIVVNKVITDNVNSTTSISVDDNVKQNKFDINYLSSKQNDAFLNNQDLNVKFVDINPTHVLNTIESEGKDEAVIVKEKNKINNRFVISALLNTDLSTVAFDDFTSPGTGLGVRLSYRLNNKFTIGAGFTRTKRIYNVSEGMENYALPQWLIDRQGAPSSLAARCDITEIPISLRYDIISLPNSNLYTQLSASTFFMDREFYDFQFDGNDPGSNIAPNWVVDRSNINKHFFGVVGVTVGYEKYFTKRIGLGLEFYWQTTLQGIGIYQINLNSVGNQILLNYRLF